MAALAQRLPISLIPEKSLVTPVRDDMVYHRRGRDHAALHTRGTQRIALQIRPARCAPFCAISPLCGAPAPTFRRFSLMFCAICSSFAQVGTSRIPAGAFWAFGHFSHLDFSCVYPQRTISPRWLYTESPPFRFFIALSSAMTSATAPSTFSVDFSLSSFRLPAGSVRT